MGPFNQIWPNNYQKVPKWPLQGLKNAIFHDPTPEYDHSDFFSQKNVLDVDFDPNLLKRDFFRKWPKIGQKMRKI